MSIFNEAELKRFIIETAKDELSGQGLALKLLDDYADVDFLTFDEACKVFRATEEELLKGIKSGNVPAPQKIGKSPDKWRFSKRLVFDCLTGTWQPQKREKHTFSGDNEIRNMALELTR